MEDISHYGDDILRACVIMNNAGKPLSGLSWEIGGKLREPISSNVLDRMAGFDLITEWEPSEWNLTPKGARVAQAVLQLKPSICPE